MSFQVALNLANVKIPTETPASYRNSVASSPADEIVLTFGVLHFGSVCFEHMNPALKCNAFRYLSLPADVELKDIYRRQNRLDIALEMGDLDSCASFRFLPALPVSREGILDAVHRLESDSNRLREEVFWLHDLNGKLNFEGTSSDAVLSSLRSQADSRTTKGAIAQHSAAVILTFLALESTGGKCLDYWVDALRYWKAAIENPVFGQFLEDRNPALDNNSSGIDDLKTDVGAILAEAAAEQVWKAIRERDFRRIAAITTGMAEHSDWMPIEAELASISRQTAKDSSNRLWAIIDRLNSIEKTDDSDGRTRIRSALVAAEREFGTAVQEVDPIFEVLPERTDWNNSKAVVLEKLSIAYYNHLEDHEEALRLVIAARQFATDDDVQARLENGWRHIQHSMIRAEAVKLMEAKSFDAAEKKLQEALPLATASQKDEIGELQKACRRARVFKDVDRSKTGPTLHTINGIGATFYGSRDHDSETDSYVTTHWFVLLFVPIIPMAAYRVSSTGGNSYNIYGKVPLSPLLKKYRWGVLAAIVLCVLWASIDSSSSSSTSSSQFPSSSGYSTPVSTSSSFSQTQRNDESAAIEAERSQLKAEQAALALEKQNIDEQEASLKRIKSDINNIKSTYTADTIPDDVRQEYNATIRNYNSRLPAYRAALQDYNDKVDECERRRAAFNARIQHYNENR